jgi:FKBP12-rapamycin complex-associated protein
LVDALSGVIHGLVLEPANALTFTLMILRLLFDFEDRQAFQLFEENVNELPIHVWIPVLPQVLSRLASQNVHVREMVQSLLIKVGLAHPHAVLFPLLVPLSLTGSMRQQHAGEIVSRLQAKFPQTVSTVLRLASEFERASVTWWETVMSDIDEASRAYMSRGDLEEMLSVMANVNRINQIEPSTFYETSFARAFGESMQLAEKWWHIFKQKRDEPSLQSLWCHYTVVFYAIKPQARELKTIVLADASPYLASLRNCEIPIPGTYEADKPVIRIQSFNRELTVIESKQRPRKLEMVGSNGIHYTFLLKAHEDTRLDERVMQLFSFINTFIETSTLLLRSRLSITTYKVIPITAEVGLIGWVPDCSTLFDILKLYREKNNMQVEAEWQHIGATCPNYDSLPLADKARVFQQAYGKSTGLDLKVMLFDNSADTADWLDRRTNYTASLATTSIAGYILGLGDRHMCNIMMKRRSAKLVHIDFGDSFEVALHRERWPERVPFRLTRLLINALEIGGIRGTFRASCENLLTLLRKNASQIVGVLSVFTYDPLRQWSVGNSGEKTEAMAIIDRIKDKLDGNDFPGVRQLTVEQQVERLVKEATAVENLCGMFKGWYAWW